jgi:cysteine-rich repeat protein
MVAMLCACSSPCSAAALSTCTGDCTGDGVVAIDDLILMTDLALSDGSSVSCPAGDINEDGHIQVDDIIAAVQAALDGCSAPPPTTHSAIEPTVSPTPTPTPTAIAVCGNGVWQNEPPEQCDDGNTESGDGCDAHCQLEFGFICTGEPTKCIYSPGCPGTFPCSGTPNPSPTPTPPPDRALKPAGVP